MHSELNKQATERLMYRRVADSGLRANTGSNYKGLFTKDVVSVTVLGGSSSGKTRAIRGLTGKNVWIDRPTTGIQIQSYTSQTGNKYEILEIPGNKDDFPCGYNAIIEADIIIMSKGGDKSNSFWWTSSMNGLYATLLQIRNDGYLNKSKPIYGPIDMSKDALMNILK